MSETIKNRYEFVEIPTEILMQGICRELTRKVGMAW